MSTSGKRAITVSAAIHAACFMLLLLSIFIGRFRREPEPHVFTLVSAPAPPQADVPREAAESEPMRMEKPALPPMPQVREFVLPPEPPPVAAKPKPVAPKPAPTVAYKDFIKKEGEPKVTGERRPQPRTPPKAPSLVSDVRSSMRDALSDSARTASNVSQSAMASYKAQVKGRLDVAFTKPPGISAYDIAAVAVFDVAPDGRIVSYRLVRKSGHAVFDAAVLAAFKRVGNVGITPDGRLLPLQLTFRMSDY